MVGANRRLRVVASKVKKQSEYNALLSAVMAEQRMKEKESKADAVSCC